MMKKIALVALVTGSLAAPFATPMPAHAATIKPEVWADNPDVSSVSLSPDGKNLAMLQRTKRGGMYQVVTFNSTDPTGSFQRLGKWKHANRKYV